MDINKIENRAKNELKAIKLCDNLYIVPDAVAKYDKSENNKINLNLFDDSQKETILSLNVNNNDKLITVCKNYSDREKKLEILNFNTGENIEIIFNKFNLFEERDNLVNTIASMFKKNVLVTCYLPYDLNGINDLLNE